MPSPTKTASIAEALHDGFAMSYEVDQILFEQQTDHQHLIIFENQRFGRIMMLDNIVQLTTADEFIYHEMMAHIPLFAHPNPKNILIIGGGDGGVAREVLRHSSVEKLTLCEIDQSVIEMGQRYFPTVCGNAFDDPRLHTEIMDGTIFVKETRQKFDAILVDSTDPIGPGAVLFTAEFYHDCAQCLAGTGILITQNGVPFLQDQELRDSMAHFQNIFADFSAFTAATPTYVGGLMAYGWGTQDKSLRTQPLASLEKRFKAEGFNTKYYNPALHQAAFALPSYIQKCIPTLKV